MNVAFMFSDAIIAGAWKAARQRLEKGRGEGAYLLDSGVILNVSTGPEPVGAKSEGEFSTKDLLFGGDLLQSDSVKVELVPSLRSRLSRAWQNLTSGFELSLSGRAVAFAGLMTVASMALGTFAPVSAEELPTVDSHNYPHYVNEAENVIDGAIAKTEVTPNNHVFRRTAAGGNDGMSGKDGIVGGLRHENTKGGSSNFCSKGPNHGEKSTLPLYKRTMTQLGNAKGYNQCWDQVKDVYTGGGTDSYGPSGYHVNVKHNDFLY